MPGVSLSVTLVPEGKLAVHVVGQLIPAGVLVTVPDPAAGAVTVSSKEVEVDVEVGLAKPAQPESTNASSTHKHSDHNL